MARYVFSYMVDGTCKLYAESTPDEEKLDVDEFGNVSIDMTGNGYLKFWVRCKGMVRDYDRLARACAHNTLATDEMCEEFTEGKECVGTITDLWYDAEKKF